MDQIRGDLLNELLKKKVTHSDIKQYNLTEAELNVLYLVDSMDRREFVYMYRRNHPDAHKKSGFKQWQRKRKRLIRSFIGVDCTVSVDVCKHNGIDTAFVHNGYKSCLPVCKYYVSYLGYSMDLLHARDELYKTTMSVDEAAKFLGMTVRRLYKVANQQEIEILTGRVFVNDLANYLWSRISHECTLLVEIAPERLENFLS